MADIGQTLREARMRARIDMTEVELQTKIRARYLRAIENEEWDLLPGPVYIKSFLRTYADFLGLDSRLLVDEFKRQYELPSDNEVRPAPPLRQSREHRERRERRERDRGYRGPRGPMVPPWAIILFVLVVVLVVLWVIGSGGGRSNRPNPTSSRGTTHKHHHAPQKLVIKHHKPKPKVAKVKLVPTGLVYICVENRAGHILVPGTTYTTGQTIPILRAPQIFITLGNNAVTMTANGKPYPVAASATAIGLKVTSKGVSSLAAGHSPTCTTTG